MRTKKIRMRHVNLLFAVSDQQKLRLRLPSVILDQIHCVTVVFARSYN